MRVSLKWLREIMPDVQQHCDDLDAFVYTLDMTGTAVEAVTVTGDSLDGVVVGQIIEKTKHSAADTLWVTQVDVAADELLQIVCGADNFQIGDKVPVATVGSTLPGGMKIKKTKLRGELSCGMNCSARELQVGGDADGLLILPKDAPVGTPFARYYNLSDTILDLEITPNRPDCLSMQGIAREVAAVFGLPTPAFDDSTPSGEAAECVHNYATVDVQDSDACPRYAAKVIRGVSVGQSPDWLVQRVEACGARSINNIVDVTNLVMFETGQPFHAFDLDAIAADEQGRAGVIVRRARAGETITTLDEVERTLTPENLLIADAKGPITLAGVMGAANTEVSEQTTNILLEAAVFEQVITSRTSRGFQLISESSLRFERGVDSENTLAALERCAALIAQLGQGQVASGTIDHYPAPYKRRTITLPLRQVNALLGTNLDLKTCADILDRLCFCVKTDSKNDQLMVTVPGFRDEVRREVDLIEEILRLYGMENTPATLPGGRQRTGGLTAVQKLRRKLERTLCAQGLYETLTLPFANPADYEKLGVTHDFARLHNPLAHDQSVLRAQLLPNLLHSLALNKNRGTRNVQLFEIGTVFRAVEGRKQPQEREQVAAVICGSWHDRAWNRTARDLDFYDAKGIVETLLRELGIQKTSFVAPDDTAYPYLQPGRIAEVHIAGRSIGVVGEVHPRVATAFDSDDAIVCFELQCKALYRAAKDTDNVQMPSKYPGIDFDVALLVDQDVSAESIAHHLTTLGKKTPLHSVRLFDLYQGDKLPAGKKSLAFSLRYQADDRTLTHAQLEPAHQALLQQLEKATGATLRE
ncbi:MAG: phenylalanine--tRNA ligase subunit beta [Coriobacteriia bacterium]|nr:phenylalanine--tRNA ligase subunit beta [Coriobacteriia bacterium]